jgi:glycosyltransferase involved in cell wall biosynthesis
MWPKQVIVVDDASNDGTLDVIDSVCRNFNGQLTVIRLSSNGGPSVARNTAWDLATQPYIAFLDSDDTWHHRKLELQYSWMKSHPETSLTCHGMRWIKRNEQPPELPDGWKSRKIRHVSLLIHCIISTPSVMLRRDLPFRFAEEKRNSEDYLLWLCIVLSGYDARVLDVPLAYTHKHFYKSSGLGSNVLGIVLGDLDTYRRLWRLRLLGTSAFVAVSLGSLLRFSVRYIRP